MRLVSAGDFVSRLVESLPGEANDSQAVEYLGMVDRALLDRHVSEREKNILVQMATDLRIDRKSASKLYASYLGSLAALAWADGVVTPAECEDLEQVAALLGVSCDEVELVLAQPMTDRVLPEDSRFILRPGDRVAFTGQMKRPRDEWYAEALAAGLEPADSVTKKTVLVVAADPDSLSGKRRRLNNTGFR